MSQPTDRPSTRNEACTHKQAAHVHGTYTCFTACKCRCEECRSANARYEKRRGHLNASGRSDLVDAAPARDHLRKLMDQGMGLKTIGRASGIGNGTLVGIIYGKFADNPNHPDYRPPRLRVTRGTQRRILGISLQLADGAKVDATGTRRRIQALVAIGWSLASLSARLGILRSNFRLHNAVLVQESTRLAVVDLYEELWDRIPPHTGRGRGSGYTRAKRYAATHGWVPPMAWDDIDDPAAEPDTGVREAGYALDDAVFLLDAGENPSAVAARLGVSLDALHRRFARAGLPAPTDSDQPRTPRKAAA